MGSWVRWRPKVTKTAVTSDSIVIVVRGQFNAAIFSPAWLLHQRLIGASDYAKASVEIVTREFASFQTAWLRCQVTPDTFQVSTTEPEEFERVRDVAVGVLSTLAHTPVAALGINREFHFSARDKDQYHAIGDQLVPKEMWKSIISLPMTRNVVVWGTRTDGLGGRIQITVEPSMRFPGHIFVSHNDHFNLQTVEQSPTNRDEAWSIEAEQGALVEPSATNIPIVTEILGSQWISSIERSNDVLQLIAGIK